MQLPVNHTKESSVGSSFTSAAAAYISERIPKWASNRPKKSWRIKSDDLNRHEPPSRCRGETVNMKGRRRKGRSKTGSQNGSPIRLDAVRRTAMDGFAGDLVFMLNGREVRLDHVDPTTLLVDYLRSAEVGLTGTKWVCRQGGCGACTVMLSHNHGPGKSVHAAINSCLRPLCSLDGMAVTTTEGIG